MKLYCHHAIVGQAEQPAGVTHRDIDYADSLGHAGRLVSCQECADGIFGAMLEAVGLQEIPA